MNTLVQEHKIYIKGRKHVPFPEYYSFGETEEMDKMLLEPTQYCEKNIPDNKSPQPDWIAEDTWEQIKKSNYPLKSTINKELQESWEIIRKQLQRDRGNRDRI